MKERRQSTEPKYLLDPLYDADGVQRSSGIGQDGREYPDPVPMSPPVGYEPPSSLEALIESIIHRRDFRQALANAGYESPEEADDFDVDEDEDLRFPETLYEKYFEAKTRRRDFEKSREQASEAGERVDRPGGPPSPPGGIADKGGSQAGVQSEIPPSRSSDSRSADTDKLKSA